MGIEQAVFDQFPELGAWVNTNLPFVVTPEVEFAAKFIAFNPIFWNIAAQLELRTGLLTLLAFKNKYWGCYMLAVAIFTLGLFRDHAFTTALADQPVSPLLASPAVTYTGIAMIGLGNVLVLTSMWALGVTGTYLGDYFGILMDEMVTGFPFNVTSNPMYVGSYLTFMGYSLYSGKSVGILLSAVVWVMYSFALKFEEPYTHRIYAERDRLREAERKNQ